jgi:hypothetical protein
VDNPCACFSKVLILLKKSDWDKFSPKYICRAVHLELIFLQEKAEISTGAFLPIALMHTQ